MKWEYARVVYAPDYVAFSHDQPGVLERAQAKLGKGFKSNRNNGDRYFEFDRNNLSLGDLLALLGDEEWEMVTDFPLLNASMLFFKRPGS